MKPTWNSLGAHLETTCGPLGVHLDSKGVPKAPRRSKSSQNVRESTVLQASLSLLEAHVEALEATWKPLAGYLGSREAPKAPRTAKSSQTVRVSMVLQVLQATQRPLGARLASLWKHLEVTWSPLGVHLDSRMHLEFSRRVPRACTRTKSSQNARVSTVSKGPVSPLGVHLEELGAHLASTWTPGCTWSSAEGFQRRPVGQNRARTRE